MLQDARRTCAHMMCTKAEFDRVGVCVGEKDLKDEDSDTMDTCNPHRHTRRTAVAGGEWADHLLRYQGPRERSD